MLFFALRQEVAWPGVVKADGSGDLCGTVYHCLLSEAALVPDRFLHNGVLDAP